MCTLALPPCKVAEGLWPGVQGTCTNLFSIVLSASVGPEPHPHKPVSDRVAVCIYGRRHWTAVATPLRILPREHSAVLRLRVHACRVQLQGERRGTPAVQSLSYPLDGGGPVTSRQGHRAFRALDLFGK